MNRETELRFSEIPEIEKPRSKFKRPFNYKTTFDAAEIVPIYLDQDILPGDTVSINMATVTRMATPLYPVMDNAYMDIMFFFVPNRLVWDHWKAFWGENTNAWYQSVEYEIPQIKTTTNKTFQAKSLADYFGLPLGTTGLSVSALPFRAYVKIWNDWFRDENLQQEAVNTNTDTDAYTSSATYQGGDLLKANKFHDYFTSALPAPQKGTEVVLPLGKTVPVYAGATDITATLLTQPLRYKTTDGTQLPYAKNNVFAVRDTGNFTNATLFTTTESTGGGQKAITPANLYADLTRATASTITELRQAFAVQRFYEAQARGGWEKSA